MLSQQMLQIIEYHERKASEQPVELRLGGRVLHQSPEAAFHSEAARALRRLARDMAARKEIPKPEKPAKEICDCRLCGGEAKSRIVEPTESTFDGVAVVSCTKCDSSIRIGPHEVPFGGGHAGQNGWDVLWSRLRGAQSEAVRRWNIFNK